MRAEPAFLVFALAVSPLSAAGMRKGPPTPLPRPSSPAAAVPRVSDLKIPAAPSSMLPAAGLEAGADGTYPGAGLTPIPAAEARVFPKDAEASFAERAAVGLGAKAEALAPSLKAAVEGESPRRAGEAIEMELTGEKRAESASEPVAAAERKLIGLSAAQLAKSPALEPADARPTIVAMTGQEILKNPGDLYELARAEAKEAARRKGWDPERVHFGYATANIPARGGASWGFVFFSVRRGENRGDTISVDFSRGYATAAGRFDVRVSLWEDGSELPAPLQPRLDDYVRKSFALGPEIALGYARLLAPRMLSSVRTLARWQEEPASGDVDMWYRFFDDLGHKVEVNARTGEARWIEKPAEPVSGSAAGWGAAGVLSGFAGLVLAILSLNRPGMGLLAWGLAFLAAGGLMVWNASRLERIEDSSKKK